MTGINLDILPFNNSDECSAGGIYVTELRHYCDYYYEYSDYARRVRIPPNALVYIEKGKLKCDQIYLEDRMKKDDLIKELFEELESNVLLELVKKNGLVLQYIKNETKTHEIMLEAVRNNGYALRYIDDEMKTKQIMLDV